MKHTIILCDLCGNRIFRDGWFNLGIANGALKLNARELKVWETGGTIIYDGWKRCKYHICKHCVEKVKKICEGKLE